MADISPNDEVSKGRSAPESNSTDSTDTPPANLSSPSLKPELEPLISAAAEFVALFRYNPDAYILTTMTEGTILAVNPGFISQTGHQPADVIGRSMKEVGLWVESAAHTQCIRELNSGETGYRELEYVTATQQHRVGSVSLEIISVGDSPVLLTIVRDISEYQQELQALRLQGKQLQGFSAIASIALQVISLPVALRAMLKKLMEVTGFPLAVIETYQPQRDVMQFFAAEGITYSDESVVEFPATATLSGTVARTRQASVKTGEALRNSGGIPIFDRHLTIETAICLPMLGNNGLFGTLTLAHPKVVSAKPGALNWLKNVANFIATYAQRALQDERNRFTAFHDPLTELPNRRLFSERVERALARSKRHPECNFAVMFLDLDNFKRINDELGHRIADLLLVELARRLESILRPGDTVARIGGDEFTFLLDGVAEAKEISRIANRILNQISQPFLLEQQEVTVTASMGIAISSSVYEHPDELLRDADAAMYRAKQSGKDRYAVFDETMHQQAQTQLQLEQELREAFERRELRVHYQPIISFKTGQIEGLEALVRWQHPQRGLLSPHDFLPIAKDCSLEEDIDRWVLQEVCRQLHEWQVQASSTDIPTIAINFSAKRLQNPRFTASISYALNQANLNPQSLRLEFAEKVLSKLPETTTASLQKLQTLGVKSAIDNFGTGVLPIGKLYDFPVDQIKIDSSFVQTIERGGQKLSLVRTLATLAKELGLSVTAEGVETAGQLSLLRAVGCESGQGYFFSEPLPKEQVWELLSSNPSWR
ncbi:MAG: EAL domain-containing protein [Synechococcus sp.]